MLVAKRVRRMIEVRCPSAPIASQVRIIIEHAGRIVGLLNANREASADRQGYASLAVPFNEVRWQFTKLLGFRVRLSVPIINT